MHNPFNERFRVEQKRAFEMYLRTGDTAAYFDVLEREEKFSPDQPRVPAGNSDGGQWTSGGGGGSGSGSSVRANVGDDGNDVGQNDPNIQPVFAPAAPIVVEKTIEAALALYVFMLGQQSSDETPFVQFNAQAFLPGEVPAKPAVKAGSLTEDEVDAACPKFGQVQTLTDEAADRVSGEGNYWTANGYGTRVHLYLKDSVDALHDPNFKAEKSVIKSDPATYGKRGSVRIDVFENVGNGDVCVYDVKTGKSGLSLARMQEIANNVHSYYPRTKKIIVIEMRPKVRRRKRK